MIYIGFAVGIIVGLLGGRMYFYWRGVEDGIVKERRTQGAWCEHCQAFRLPPFNGTEGLPDASR